MLPDLNRLKVFYYVYRALSVVGAARYLNISQPAVSQQLHKLEHELKTPLFTRLHKKLVPTAAGERLFKLTAPMLEGLEKELPFIRQPLDTPCGQLRIGSPREFGKYYLPRFCADFRKRYPDVSFAFQLKEAIPLLTQIREGSLDFALIDVYYEKNELAGFQDIFSFDPLLREEMILVCSKEYYHQRIAGNHSLEHLATQDFITDEDDPSIIDLWFRHHFAKVPENLNVVMRFDNHEALLASLILSQGVGVATAHLIWDELRNGELIPLTTGKNNMVSMISLVQLQDKIPTLTEKTFRDFLLKAIQQQDVQERFQRIRQIEAIFS
jgi:DNA-binding transcriptional LysR family regulator